MLNLWDFENLGSNGLKFQNSKPSNDSVTGMILCPISISDHKKSQFDKNVTCFLSIKVPYFNIYASELDIIFYILYTMYYFVCSQGPLEEQSLKRLKRLPCF